MLVTVKQDRFGNVYMYPTSERIRNRFQKIRGRNQLFGQGDQGEELLGFVPDRALRDIREGWFTKVRMNESLFLDLLGEA